MIVITMGVVGVGKTTVGRLLAERLGWEFADADDYHSQANVDKIRRGIPLDDEDRQPWLERLRGEILAWSSQARNVVLACSALKSRYRQRLKVAPEVQFVYLKGSASLIASRLRSRPGHFANEQILASQIADLEEPEGVLAMNIEDSPEEIVAGIQTRLGLA